MLNERQVPPAAPSKKAVFTAEEFTHIFSGLCERALCVFPSVCRVWRLAVKEKLHFAGKQIPIFDYL